MRETIFGLPRGTPLDRNGKVRVIAYAKGYNAAHRDERTHIGPLTRATLDVLRALVFDFHNGATGACFPGHDRIAEKANCCEDTVAVGIKALERAGVLTWCHRIRRVAIHAGRQFMGWRVLRTSNAYWFTCLPRPAIPRPDPIPENPGGTPSKDFLPLSPKLAAALERLGRAVRGSQGAT